MSLLKILVMANSENIDIWPVTFDLIKKNFKTINIIVCVDDIVKFKNAVDINNYNIDVEKYNNNDTYIKRLNDFTKTNNSEYLLVIRDNDWICYANETNILNLITKLEKHNIDRLALYSDGNYDNSNNKESYEKIIIDDENYFINCKDYYNFSYMPSIWKNNSLSNLTSRFLDLTYRDFESSEEVQNFTRINFIVYSAYSMLSSKKTWGICLIPYFEFIHIFYKGKWILSSYDTMLDEFNILIKTYNINIESRMNANILEHK